LTFPGVVAALELETRGLIKSQAVEGAMIRCSGVGPNAARLAAESLLDAGAAALLSWGSTGGLSDGLKPGSLILPEKILCPDQTSFTVDAEWHERLRVRLSNHLEIHTGILFQSSSVLTSPSEKKELNDQYGAVAVDMESAAVARVASKARVPFIAMRAVTDTADMVVPASALAATEADGRLSLRGLFKGLARHPQELYPMFRLGRNFFAARRTLTTVVRLTGGGFLAP